MFLYIGYFNADLSCNPDGYHDPRQSDTSYLESPPTHPSLISTTAAAQSAPTEHTSEMTPTTTSVSTSTSTEFLTTSQPEETSTTTSFENDVTSEIVAQTSTSSASGSSLSSNRKQDSKSTAPTSTYVGVGIGIALSLGMVAVVVLFVYRRKRNKHPQPSVAYTADTNSAQRNESVANIYTTNDDVMDSADQQPNEEAYEYVGDAHTSVTGPDVVQYAQVNGFPEGIPSEPDQRTMTSSPKIGFSETDWNTGCATNEYDLERATVGTAPTPDTTEYAYATRGDVTSGKPEVDANKPEMAEMYAVSSKVTRLDKEGKVNDVPDDVVMTDNELYAGDVVVADDVMMTENDVYFGGAVTTDDDGYSGEVVMTENDVYSGEPVRTDIGVSSSDVVYLTVLE